MTELPDPGCGESGAAGSKRGKSGIRNRNYDPRSDPRSFAYAAEPRNYRRSAQKQETFELLSALNTGHAGIFEHGTCKQRERYDLPSGNDGADGSAAPVGSNPPPDCIGNRNSRAFRTRGGWKPSGGGDRRDHRDGGGRNQNGFFVSKRIWGEACKRQANWYTEKNWRGKQDENT